MGLSASVRSRHDLAGGSATSQETLNDLAINVLDERCRADVEHAGIALGRSAVLGNLLQCVDDVFSGVILHPRRSGLITQQQTLYSCSGDNPFSVIPRPSSWSCCDPVSKVRRASPAADPNCR